MKAANSYTELLQFRISPNKKNASIELLLAKEKAEESDRLKTAFLHNMSHEIRTPMNAVMGFANLLPENFDNRAKLEKFSEIINVRCKDLLVLINDILDIAKIESGQLTTSLEVCSKTRLFYEIESFFQEQQVQMKKQHIQLSLEIKEDIGDEIIVTDKVKFKQIFINLLSNAFKFTESGNIKFGCSNHLNSGMVYFVSDTGIGIPFNKQAEIFERFTQLSGSKFNTSGGTGLGLSIVRGLIDLLGGNIWLESEPRERPTFYFTLLNKLKESK